MKRMKYYKGIKICPNCKGVGIIDRSEYDAKMQEKPEREVCPQCQGSGRIEYRTEVKIIEEPYPGLQFKI